MDLKFKQLDSFANLPQYAHDSDSGMDVRSVEAYTLEPLGRHTFSTGVACDIPEGYDLQVRPRSGLASKHGVVAMFGTVDQGYRGEIGITLINLSNEPYTVKVGDKIAQLVVGEVVKPDSVSWTDNLSSTDRGDNGFGSTGK